MHKVKKKGNEITADEIFLPTTPEDIAKEEKIKEIEDFKAMTLPTKPEELEED